MAKYRLLAFTNPVVGREAEFNRWYTERHIHDLLAIPGFISAQRFALSGALGQDQPWSYLALYEFESDDANATMADMQARAGTAAMPISEALDMASFNIVLATPITACMPPKTA